MIDNGVQIFIHIENLRANVRRVREKCPSLLPVIKNDAYGHGVLRIAQTLASEGVEQFAVGTVDEAAYLRANGVRAGLVSLLGAMSTDDARRAAALDIMPLLHSFDELELFESLDRPINVVIKCDTGMGRLGFVPDELPLLLERLASLPHIHPQILLSHLACADEDNQDDITIGQIRTFARALATLRTAFPSLRPSLLNSGGVLTWPALAQQAPDLGGMEFYRELVRPGLILYGDNPLNDTAREATGKGFVPVMEVRTSVLAVRDVAAGQGLSYGHTFVAPRSMRVAIIAAGYAEGFPRTLSNTGYVALRGGRARIVGRVCMQMTFVDVTNLPQTKRGDPVWLLGGPADTETPPIIPAELGRWSGLMSYEFLCSLGKNNRTYVD